MVFILPNKRDGLAEVEAKLASADLYAIDNGLHSVEVEVSLPRFKLEESLELVDYLQVVSIDVYSFMYNTIFPYSSSFHMKVMFCTDDTNTLPPGARRVQCCFVNFVHTYSRWLHKFS